ncbi:hypothetical protein GGR32_000148 [Mesonia hippocampi]|uniref:Phage head morphogenesis domain-containing protein n=2 Tax=Mesonia hippocampi TaxID=1628250 RepID=A0A840ER99_9FLAO|nr:hypothetical protein [Mesonia hippocampi]
MASRWQEAERTKELYPNLMYVSVNDDRTRPLHKKWHGIVLPIDHPFWDKRYPPNDWGCRCSARRTSKPVNDNGIDVDDMVDLPKQFNINVGKTGKVFNDDHPYFKVPGFDKVAQEALRSLLHYQRKKLWPEIKDTLRGKVNTVLGEVTINNKALKEALNQPHKNAYLKNNLIVDIHNLLKDSVFITSIDNFKPSPHWVKYHYLQVKEFEDMFLIVREDRKGNFFFYSIIDNMKV